MPSTSKSCASADDTAHSENSASRAVRKKWLRFLISVLIVFRVAAVVPLNGGGWL